MKTELDAKEKIELYNLFKVAFCKYRGQGSGVKIAPKMGESGKVIFEITGANVGDLINEFYANPLIRLNDFLKHLSNVRALTLATKELNQSGEGEQ